MNTNKEAQLLKWPLYDVVEYLFFRPKIEKYCERFEEPTKKKKVS